jgi:hypothetical protein
MTKFCYSKIFTEPEYPKKSISRIYKKEIKMNHYQTLKKKKKIKIKILLKRLKVKKTSRIIKNKNLIQNYHP